MLSPADPEVFNIPLTDPFQVPLQGFGGSELLQRVVGLYQFCVGKGGMKRLVTRLAKGNNILVCTTFLFWHQVMTGDLFNRPVAKGANRHS